MSLVELGYRRAKAVKAVKKALDTGKIVKKNNKKSEHPNQRQQSRTREMQELFQSDMSEKKQKRNSAPGKKKSKHSFKSKSRYELAYNPIAQYFRGWFWSYVCMYMCVFVAYVFHVCMYDLQIFYAKNNDMGGSKRKLF